MIVLAPETLKDITEIIVEFPNIKFLSGEECFLQKDGRHKVFLSDDRQVAAIKARAIVEFIMLITGVEFAVLSTPDRQVYVRQESRSPT